MASKTVTFGQSGTRPYGVLTVTETTTSTANNTSTVNVKLVLKRPYAISSSATKTATVNVNGTVYNWSGTIGGSGDLTLIDKTLTVAHNADGTKTIGFSASIQLDITWSGTQIGTISGSGSLALTNIPRYASVSQSVASRTETTIAVKWASDSIIDYVWYSTNNGNSWTGVNVADGKSGTYTISGLKANTTYQIKTRVRSKVSQLTTDSSSLGVATYQYPYANSMPNFTIGAKLTIGFFNPLGRTITVQLIGADNSVISTDTVSGGSISGYNNLVNQSNLYASIPNAQSGRYSVKVTYGGQTQTKTGGTYKVDTSVCKPTIGGASYADVNSTTTGITGNAQQIIQNQSTVRYTATGLAAKNSATISGCSVKVNGNTYNMPISGTTATGGNAAINSGTNVQAVITVTDSRGLTASKTITVTMLELSNPKALITLQRQDNFYTATNITVDATYSYVDGKNTISIAYACTKDGDGSATVSGTLSDNVQSTIQLDNAYSWAVKVTLTDRFGLTTVYNMSVSRGMPIIFFDRLLSSVGINCFPQFEQSLELNGVSMERNVATRSLSAVLTTLVTGTYTVIPLNLSNIAGSLLTASGNGIKIGNGVSKVLISGAISYDAGATAGIRYARIVKNSDGDSNTLSMGWETLQPSETKRIVLQPVLVDVSENDIIYLYYYTTDSSDVIGGNNFGNRTSLTVEVIA